MKPARHTSRLASSSRAVGGVFGEPQCIQRGAFPETTDWTPKRVSGRNLPESSQLRISLPV